MNCAAIHTQPREYPDTGPVAKGEIHIDATNRIEALLWKLRIRLLFIGAAITTR